MHRTQLYIEENIFTQVKKTAKELDMSISEFIRKAIKNELSKESNQDMETFINDFKPVESFNDVDAEEYVDTIRAKSRIINE